MRVVGVGQGGTRHATAEAHAVQLAAHRPQACLDIAKTLAVSQLSEGHCQILVATREASVVRITPVAGDTLVKLVGGRMLHPLDENSLAEIASYCRQSQLARVGPVFASFSLGKTQSVWISFNGRCARWDCAFYGGRRLEDLDSAD
jgi:hypothetical protein